MTRALIMAGGRGLRLHPITENIPKPMIKIGTKPILQTIVEKFVAAGVSDIALAVHYKAEMIERWFGNGSRFGAAITYIIEDQPLGTAGALAYLPPSNQPTIVNNADVLSDIDYTDLISKFERVSPPVVMMAAVALYQQQIRFGVVDFNDNKEITRLREGPIEGFNVLAGTYILSEAARAHVVKGEHVDMPDLIKKMREFGSWNVVAYELDSWWVDVGKYEDLGVAMVRAST